MKKGLSILLALTLLFTMALAGCGGNNGGASVDEAPVDDVASEDASVEEPEEVPVEETSEEEAGDGEKYKIGILAPAVTHGWVAAVAYNAEERCKELSDTVEYMMYTSNNAEEMTNQLDDLKTWGAQAIVAFPQWEGMEVPIEQAHNEGIVIVNFDIEIAVDGIYRVSGDNYDMGVQGGKYIVDKVGEEATVVILEVPTAGSVSELRKAGFLDTVEEIAPDLNILTYATQFTREDGLKDFADILTANSEIDAVYSLDDETSIGVLQAIREANRTDIKVITGGGGCQEYFNLMTENDDIWIQSALYSPAMVKDAVDVAVKVLKGESVDDVTIIPTTIVDRANCSNYLDEKSPY